MPKARTAASVLTCDICGFKVSNPYIFKRHLHKCYTLHGIAANRSTPRHPIRLKGTEGVRSSDHEVVDQINDGEGKIESPQVSGENLVVVKDEVERPSHSSGLLGDEEDGSIGSVSSHWGVTNSPQLTFEHATPDKKDDDTISETETPSPMRAKFERKYNCERCSFETLKSRHYLYHLRDVHGQRLNIFECHLCDYASRYNNKLARHMTVHKKPGGPTFSLDSAIISNQRLRVKPLKLKRLSITTSAEFEVSPIMSPKPPSRLSPSVLCKASPSPTSKMSPAIKSKVSPAMTSNLSPPMIKSETDAQVSPIMPKAKQREVFKMVLAEDGSHHYQCRSCLFYTNSSHNVKKHFVLCHSKALHCSYCKYVTTEQAEYYEHILTHAGPGKMSFMKCEDCSYVTNARSNFEKHRSFHGADFPFRCTVCNFAAESESKVKRHMATQHTNQNSGEDMEEKPMETELLVMDTEGQPTMDERLPVSPKKKGKHNPDGLLIKYRCPQCPIVCLRRGNFTRHLVARHNFTQKSASSNSKSMERRLLRKGKLQKELPSAVSMQKRRQLLYTGDCWKCSECSYTAKWPSDLRRHRQVHTLVKRFKCSMCNNKYKYLGDLNVHMRRDHMTEPLNITAKDFVGGEVVRKASPALFRCPICPFTTHSKADLEQHSKLHKDIEKTFRCRFCDYQTYWRGDVGRHLFRHHSILLGKESQEMETYFIHRPEIRPLTKKPQHSNLSLNSSRLKKMDLGDIVSMDSQDSNGEQNLDGSESSYGKLNRNPALVSRKEGQFACNYPDCDYRTTTAERLESHCAYHENLKQFMCPTCGKRTNWKWDIVKHMNKVHKNSTATTDDVVTLPIEEARATISDYLSQSERKSGGLSIFLCSQCDFKSGDKARVTNHLAVNHKDEYGSVLSTLKSHSSSDSMSVNNSRDSEEPCNLDDIKMDLFVDPPSEELAKIDKPFACAVCKKPEISKVEVKKHYNYAHAYKDIRIIYTVDGTEFDYNTNEIYYRKSDPLLESGEQSTSSVLKSVKPDSKYSNPRMHGYVKPFKCSICGLRSNWKWDLKKHLRAKHPSQGGFVIMLSIAEAKSTYAFECSPSHPKDVNKQPKYVEPRSELEPSPTSSSFKHPFSVKGEPYDTNYGIFGSLKSPQGERITNFDPNRRQWKCSGCSYISNWRRNMARHIQRHHALDKSKVRVIALHLLNKETQQKFLKEQSVRQSMKAFKYNAAKEDGGPCGLWQCPKCPFQSTLRTHIIIHMQKHEMKPFSCMVCNSPFMNRGPLHRHIQKVHRRSDYVKLCKVNIDFGDGEAEDNVYICCVCQLESSVRFTIESHIAKEHDVKDVDYYIVCMQKNRNERPLTSSSPLTSPEQRIRSRKTHFCQLCPYRSQKKSMLSFHMSYHKPTPANRFKCKYCPYYVSTTRLLHQHQRKWHCEKRHAENVIAGVGWDQGLSTPPASPLKHSGRAEQTAGSARRHFCEKCPYTTNSKNDFIYHKQFHRPKRTAEYKCEYCDYWVVHKRLLKQHMRLHTEEASCTIEVSPTKSIYSDPGLVYDPVELTELAAIKQQMISAKITPSLSKSPKFSPMKMATKLSVDDKPGYVLKNGLYRKLHKCRWCPYTNTRARNMQLHEMMHGPRQCSYPLMKCPYCDYYVGSKGLLSHHMKVHSKNYGDTPENDALMTNLCITDDDDASDTEIQTQQKVDTLLSISRFKRYGCEKCPYASAKRQHFERHLELHGSRQRYTCQYCDYSVPSSCLLTQHSKLHLMPNQNLLASQSINNLQFMSEVPADVALASALPPTDRDMPVTISVIHDHLGLYENSIYDAEPKKLYRCDRCPYANVRRDYLLSHLKFHMVPSSMVCPYCDYSAPKQALLIQHIRVHFCPLPELSDWLLENGQMERETSQRNIDLAEALKVAHEYQNQSKKRSKVSKPEAHQNAGNDENTEEKENMEEGQSATLQQTLICQYCDREFSSSEKLVKHELQHLIGNQFEMALKSVSEDQQQNASSKKATKSGSKKGGSGTKEAVKKEPTNIGDSDRIDVSVNEVETPEGVDDCLFKLDDSADESIKLELSINTDISEDLHLSILESLQEKLSVQGTDNPQEKDGYEEKDNLMLDISQEEKDDQGNLQMDDCLKDKKNSQEIDNPEETEIQENIDSEEKDNQEKDNPEETNNQVKDNLEETDNKEKDHPEETENQEKDNPEKDNQEKDSSEEKDNLQEKANQKKDNPKEKDNQEKDNSEKDNQEKDNPEKKDSLKKDNQKKVNLQEKDNQKKDNPKEKDNEEKDSSEKDSQEKDNLQEKDNQKKDDPTETDNQEKDNPKENNNQEEDNLLEKDKTQLGDNSHRDKPQEKNLASDLRTEVESLKEDVPGEEKMFCDGENLDAETNKKGSDDLKNSNATEIEMSENRTLDKDRLPLITDAENKDDQCGDGETKGEAVYFTTADATAKKPNAADIEQDDGGRKGVEKMDEKGDGRYERKEEIGDVIDEIEKLLEDVEMPSPDEEREPGVQEGNEHGKSQTDAPSRGPSEQEEKDGAMLKKTALKDEEVKDSKVEGGEDNDNNVLGWSEESMDVSGCDGVDDGENNVSNEQCKEDASGIESVEKVDMSKESSQVQEDVK